MNVLADRHHADLFYALQLQVENRDGDDLYTPMGHDWWDEGYWRFGQVYGDDRLAGQFLVSPIAEAREMEPGLWLTFDPHHPERPIYGVSLARARTMIWKSVIATVEENQSGFARFAREYAAEGGYLYHIGNANQPVDYTLRPSIISGPQLFDHHRTFRWRPPIRQDRIVSFVNLLPLVPEMWEGFAGLRDRLPGYGFRSYGHECPDGFLRPVANVAEEMAAAGWAYHDKVTGDGFGHVIAGWAAVGRPLIGHARYYRGQWAEPLWRDMETCIDLDRHSLEEAATIIEGMSKADHALMCANIRQEFAGLMKLNTVRLQYAIMPTENIIEWDPNPDDVALLGLRP
jgi:hypothetical protein